MNIDIPIIDLFNSEEIAKAYVQYRPAYPKDLYDKILQYLQNGENRRQLAVDIGCGSGQTTFSLAEYFDKVLGLDSSDAQLHEARQRPDLENVSFRACDAHDLGFLADDSVDLVTCGCALHWFDTERFLREVQRVLRPEGVFAGYAYDFGFSSCTLANGENFTYFSEVLYPLMTLHKAKHAMHCHNGYSDLFQQLQQSFSQTKRDDSILLKSSYSVDAFCGFFRSSSRYRLFKTACPSDPDPLDQLAAELYKAYEGKPPAEAVKCVKPLFLIMGKKNSVPQEKLCST